jgi:hypothetical protein
MDWEPADILGFYGRHWKSRVIEIATRGPSHVGIVTPFYNRGPKLVESTTLCDLPDDLSGEVRAGVQFHDPRTRIDSYDGDVYLHRLSDGWKLDQHEIEWLQGWFYHRRKQVYDVRRALLSATHVLKWTSLLPYPDAGSVFCSMLCAAALMRLHRLPLDNPNVYNPASLIRELRRCGIYGPPQKVSKGT